MRLNHSFKFLELSNVFDINAAFMVWAHVGTQHDIIHSKVGSLSKWKTVKLLRGIVAKNILISYEEICISMFSVLVLIDKLR